VSFKLQQENSTYSTDLELANPLVKISRFPSLCKVQFLIINLFRTYDDSNPLLKHYQPSFLIKIPTNYILYKH
jgi:hypothetical protein